MWMMTTDFSELTPRQTRRVVRFTEPMFLTRSSPRADWLVAKLRGKTLFVVRHFVTLMAGTARACSAVFETCHSRGVLGTAWHFDPAGLCLNPTVQKDSRAVLGPRIRAERLSE